MAVTVAVVAKVVATKVRERKNSQGYSIFDPAIHIKEMDRELGIFF